jgi:Leucine-rich repeat (LRR) protein
MEEEDPEILTDEDSSYGPIPPPPEDDPEAIIQNAQHEYEMEKARNNEPEDVAAEEEEEEEDDDDFDDMPDKIDPPQDDVERSVDITTLVEGLEDDDESVEIAPTAVVQRMINDGDEEDSAAIYKSENTGSCHRIGLWGSCICLIILAIVLGAGFGTGAFTSQESSAKEPDNGGNDEPPDNGGGGDSSTRASDISVFLSSVSLAPDQLQQENTAESAAVSWLVADDPLQLGAQSSADQFRLIQRYALAAFWFSSTNKWNEETGWLQEPDECTWFGVSCEQRIVNGESVNVVTSLALPSNNINSYIIPDLALLESIATWDLSDNKVQGDLTDFAFDRMTNITSVIFQANNVTGDLSSFAKKLSPTIKVLNLENNQVSGSIPDEFEDFTALTELNLASNALSGAINSVLGVLPIKILRLGNNNWSAGSIPTFVYTLPLEELCLENSGLTGSIEGAVGSVTTLRVLQLEANNLSGGIPSAFTNLVNLEVFTAHENLLTGTLPDLSVITALNTLRLSNNELTGPIPDIWSALASLTMLRLDQNQFTGAIPSSVTQLLSLEIFRLDNNLLSGTLPINIGAMFNLKDLRVNAQLNPAITTAGLRGPLPDSIGNCLQLEQLYLRSNLLTGTLPTTLGRLESLQVFDASFNLFTGAIPDSISSWSDNIVEASFAGNSFTGSVPTGICGGTIESLLADCAVECSCCTAECVA